MSYKRKSVKLIIGIMIVLPMILLASQKKQNNDLYYSSAGDTVVKIVYETIYTEKVIHDTIIQTQISYVDTTPIVLNTKRSFIYIRDTFNIEDRTYYITEVGDTVKAFYFDYTYYIFKYHFKDTLVTVDSVLGCDLYTHCICDDRERVVIFHTCEGESRTIINLLNEK